MTFHEYVRYKGLSYKELGDKTGINKRRLIYSNCENSLDSREIDKLKELIGDWTKVKVVIED